MAKGFKYFIATAIFAIGSVICFFNINSYFADTHHLNGIIGFLGAGILLGLIAIFLLSKAVKASG